MVYSDVNQTKLITVEFVMLLVFDVHIKNIRVRS